MTLDTFQYHILTSTFSTTCLPKEQTLVDEVIIMFSELSYWLDTP